jgi:predicted metal-dependent hydrolase
VRQELEDAIRELEDAARELRGEDLPQERAAELVDRCAEIAARVGGELDRAARDAEREMPGAGQEQLL